MVGYGLYWYCLELIARNISTNNITFELEHDSETIALEWGLDQLKVQEIMEYMVDLRLFEESGGRITCLKLAFRLDDTNAKNPEIKKIQDQIRKNSEKLRLTPKVSAQTRLDENREKNTSKPDGLNQYESDFMEFWRVYPRKENKIKAAKAWKRLTQAKKEKALADCQIRYQHTEKRFIPLPTTYLHGERWEDERGETGKPKGLVV